MKTKRESDPNLFGLCTPDILMTHREQHARAMEIGQGRLTTETEAKRQTEGQTGRQADRQPDSQTHKQTSIDLLRCQIAQMGNARRVQCKHSFVAH